MLRIILFMCSIGFMVMAIFLMGGAVKTGSDKEIMQGLFLAIFATCFYLWSSAIHWKGKYMGLLGYGKSNFRVRLHGHKEILNVTTDPKLN